MKLTCRDKQILIQNQNLNLPVEINRFLFRIRIEAYMLRYADFDSESEFKLTCSDKQILIQNQNLNLLVRMNVTRFSPIPFLDKSLCLLIHLFACSWADSAKYVPQL